VLSLPTNSSLGAAKWAGVMQPDLESRTMSDWATQRFEGLVCCHSEERSAAENDCGLKGEEVTGRWRKLRATDTLHILYFHQG
jgi:hypothetical protein